MIRYRRAAAAVAVAAFALCGSAGTAQAQPSDERFQEAIGPLGLQAGPGVDLVAMGHMVCDTLTQQLAANPNPAPIVRGVVNTLKGSNMTKEQAVGFLRASVAVYCPQHGRFTGR